VNNIQQNIDDYLADLEESPVQTMKEIVEFNRRYSLVELPPGMPLSSCSYGYASDTIY